MSSKKSSGDMKNKAVNTRKNTRRSLRNTSMSNGDTDGTKERNGQQGHESKVEGDAIYDQNIDGDFYKDLIDLLPLSELNCSPAECPAPPGTRVNLHGVILHETLGGLVVLNIRWRNKVYSGALIDVEKNKWATEKIPCDPPSAQDNKQFPPPPPIKKIKIPTSTLQLADDSDSGSSKKKNIPSPTTPSKNSKFPRGNNKKRTNQDTVPANLNGDDSPLKKNKTKLCFVNGNETSFECPEPNCGKRYKNKNGLSYHQKTAHFLKNESCDDSAKENKSDVDSDSGDDQFVIDERSCSEIKKEETDDTNLLVNSPAVTENKNSMNEYEKEMEKLKIKTIKQEELVDYQSSESRQEQTNCLKSREEQPNGELEGFSPNVVKESDKSNFSDGHVSYSFISTPSQNPLQIDSLIKEGKGSPCGSQHTIIHDVNQFSNFNKLFAHTEHFSQFSPTLSNLSLKNVHDSVNEVSDGVKTSSLESMRYMAPTKLPIETPMRIEPAFHLPSETATTFVAATPNIDIVGSSDTEQSPPPESILINCHKTYHLDESEPKHVLTSGFSVAEEMFKSSFQEGGNAFEKSLLFKELAVKTSSTTNNVLRAQTSPQHLTTFNLPNKDMQDFSHFDSKNIPPQLFNLLKQDSENKFDCSSLEAIESGKQTLLEQRLVVQPGVKGETPFGPFVSTAVTTPTGISPNFERSVEFPDKQTLTSSSFNMHDITLQQRLRDNEDVNQTKSFAWSPGLLESPKESHHQYFEMFKNSPLSSSFRMQIPAINSNSDKKRSVHPVPIAPAPISIQHLRDSVTSPLETDQPQMSRFTLTSDRLVHNPIENRGRPRKFRSEVCKQASVIDPLEQGKVMFGFAENAPLCKQNPALRASVIQGANLGFEESIKVSERSPDGRQMVARPQSRPTQMRDRFTMHALDGKASDIRVDRYKELSPPPRVFLPPNNSKNHVTPPHSRAPSHSPRESTGHSSSLSAEIVSKTQYEQAARERFEKMSSPNFYERQRNKQNFVRTFPEHSRAANDHQRLGDVHRNNTFVNVSPHDTIPAMQSYARNQDIDKEQQRAADFRIRYQSSPSHRIDGLSSRNESRTVYDHRVPNLDDGEQARLRERFLHQTTMQTGLSRSISPPASHSAVQPTRPSTNLVLTRADGAFLGPLSFENRTEHKR